MIRSALLALPFAALLGAPRAHGDWGVAYAPADATADGNAHGTIHGDAEVTPEVSSRRPAIVFLHGMWSSPEDSCDAFASAARPYGFLVCPRGNAPLRDPRDASDAGDAGDAHDASDARNARDARGASSPVDAGDGGMPSMMWSGSWVDAARSIHAALDAADKLAPGRRAHVGGTLIGYSNGAYFAAEVAAQEPGRWTSLVLISMRLDLDAARLRRAGVTRIVLAAGDRDDASASMRALAARLDAADPADASQGRLEARYMSLGDVGHWFPADMPARMDDAVAWARGAPSLREGRR